MTGIVRQHSETASALSIWRAESASRGQISSNLEIKKSALMRRTSCSDFLILKSIECNETLHVARYDKYPDQFLILSKSYRTIKRYQTKKDKEEYKIMEPIRRRTPLHRYYSSSLSLYRACSTSHYDQHCATAQRNCFRIINFMSGECISRQNFIKYRIQKICSHETNFVFRLSYPKVYRIQ